MQKLTHSERKRKIYVNKNLEIYRTSCFIYLFFFLVASYWFNMCQSVHNVDCGKSSAICRTDGLGGTAVSLGSLHAQDIIYSGKADSSCVDVVITARSVTDSGVTAAQILLCY